MMSWREWHEVVLTKEELECLIRGVRILLQEAEENEAWEKEEAARLRDVLEKLLREAEHDQ